MSPKAQVLLLIAALLAVTVACQRSAMEAPLPDSDEPVQGVLATTRAERTNEEWLSAWNAGQEMSFAEAIRQ